MNRPRIALALALAAAVLPMGPRPAPQAMQHPPAITLPKRKRAQWKDETGARRP